MARKRSKPTLRLAADPLLEDASLLDVVDSVVNHGVVLQGDLILGVANVDLIYIKLSALGVQHGCHHQSSWHEVCLGLLLHFQRCGIELGDGRIHELKIAARQRRARKTESPQTKRQKRQPMNRRRCR